MSNPTQEVFTEEQLQQTQKLNIELKNEITELTNKLSKLKSEHKMNNILIFKHCKHEWKLDTHYFSYDERPNICTKCNMVRN